MPGVAASEIYHYVDAALIAAPLRLAIFLYRPFCEIDFADVDHLVSTEFFEPVRLLGAAGAGDDGGAEMLGENDASGAHPTACAEDQHAVAALDRVVGDQHAVRGAIGDRQRGRFLE